MKKTMQIYLTAVCASVILAFGGTAAQAARETDIWIVADGSCPAPVYPEAARMKEETGVVVLSMLIDTKGTVTDSVVLRSSGHVMLDEAAVAWLPRCRFRLRDSAVARPAEPVWQQVAYRWKLE